MENNNSEQKFHVSRIAFMIINNEIIYLENSKMSHIEWYKSLGYKEEDFNNIVRGYTKDNKIIFYKGDFLYDDETINTAITFAPIIKEYINNENAEVYAGVIKGKIGEQWEPCLKIEVNTKKVKR
ncbi:MAG: hypothetical protein E7157_03440 [Lactobacillales bacterium]|nr:hypothetical protein [Lactobacillales bacterium]